MQLSGLYDIHVHPSPGVKKRKFTDPELAERMRKAGAKGFVIKNHFTETAARAALLQSQYPDLVIRGGIALNRPNGGLNPYAVENCAQLGGRIVWMPTLESRSYKLKKIPSMSAAEAATYITLLDEEGNLLPSLYDIIDIVAKYDLTLATGHVSAREGIKLLTAAHAKGVKKLIVTHADNPADFYTLDEQKQCVALGAVIEHCYFNVFNGQTKAETLAKDIAVLGPENVVLSTDVGQPGSPYSDEAMATFIETLTLLGVSSTAIETMMGKNPERFI